MTSSKEILTAIFDILRRYGFLVNEQQYLHYEKFNTTDELLDYLLSPNNIIYRHIKLSENEVFRSTDSYIVKTKEGNILEIVHSRKGTLLYDPITKNSKRLKDSDLLFFSDEAIAIPKPILKDGYRIKNILKMIYKTLSFLDIAKIVLCTLVISLCGILIVEINNYVLQEWVPSEKENYWWLIFLILILSYISVYIVKNLFEAASGYLRSGIVLKVTSFFESASLMNVLLSQTSDFVNSNASSVATKLNNTKDFVTQIVGILLAVLMSFFCLIIYIPQMVNIAPELWYFAIVLIVIRILISLFLAYFSIKNEQNKIQRKIEFNEFSYSVLQAIQKIKISHSEDAVEKKWNEIFKNLLKVTSNPNLLIKLNSSISSFISSLCSVIIIAIAVYSSMSSSNFVVFNTSLLMVTSSFMGLSGSITSLLKALKKYDHVKEILKTENYNVPSVYIPTLSGNIQISHLSYSYEDCAFPVLKDINISIEKGEKVAIVGESGCGKSTLLSLILGQSTIEHGKITFDGFSMDKYTGRTIRKQIGSVLQYNNLFPGTIYENLCFDNRLLTRAEAYTVLDIVCMKDLIDSMKDGIDTEITEAASGGLSGGEKQRLLIAKALCSKKPILILDEATSALDNITQKKILNYVMDLNITVIMVAHRLSTIKGCDKIFVIENGEIVEQGKYVDLLDKKGKFYTLVERQKIVK